MCTEQICHSIQVFREGIEYKKIGPATFNYNTKKLKCETELKIFKNFEFEIDDIRIEKHPKE